ncbi:MAG: RDD family protein [Planctomycetaceae bacterium]
MSPQRKQQVDTRVVVETPEGADFEFVIAGPGTRAVAWLLDEIIQVSVLLALLIVSMFLWPFGEAGVGLGIGGMMIAKFLLDWFYFGLFEAFWNGQTPGKRSVGLRVVRSNGTPVDASSAIGRNFLRAADMLPFFYTIGMISMLMTRRLQRLGDLIFDTMVIDERREWISRSGGLTANIEALQRGECLRRFSVPERTLAVIERLFETDRIISEARREEISRPLSEALRGRLGYVDPPPDPRNPHVYFRSQGLRHTQFILRVLKTFADNPQGIKPVTNAQRRQRRSLSKSVAVRQVADETDDLEMADILDEGPTEQVRARRES